MTVAEAIGYLCVGRLLAASVYEDHIGHDDHGSTAGHNGTESPTVAPHGTGSGGDHNTCIGVACFQSTFYVAICLCLSGAASSLYLSVRMARSRS